MRRIALLAGAGILLALLVIAQLLLPGIAEQRLRDRLARSGEVLSVRVSAFPAIELLWHHADTVEVRMGSYRSDAGHLSGLLSDAENVGAVDASASEVDAGLLRLREATLRKRGDRLTGTALVTEADLRAAVPFLDAVQPVASSGGRLVLRGTATVLGLTGGVDATISAREGRLLVEPDVPLGGLATLTIFDNPHVQVQSVSGTPSVGGFLATAEATLH
ncbi:MAG: LmeA family phospholipid-binding protein [Solirubrobacterales bacterium]|nr:LmeA family phospholipid-binding protein [Solirubrobacterales bacterium]